jgi:hypothetical protein
METKFYNWTKYILKEGKVESWNKHLRDDHDWSLNVAGLPCLELSNKYIENTPKNTEIRNGLHVFQKNVFNEYNKSRK